MQVSEAGTARVTMPLDVAHGSHRLALYDADGALIGWAPISVIDPTTTSAPTSTGNGANANTGAESTSSVSSSTLAATGTTPVGIVIVALMLITTGILARRRTLSRRA
ncbi:MAG: hypothetical protein ACTJHU_03855 [Mycetocola sp.]